VCLCACVWLANGKGKCAYALARVHIVILRHFWYNDQQKYHASVVVINSTMRIVLLITRAQARDRYLGLLIDCVSTTCCVK